MASTQLQPFGVIEAHSGGAVFVDHACGSCINCAAGFRSHCTVPIAEGRRLTSPVPTPAVDVLRAGILAVAALIEAPEVATVVVAGGSETSPLAVLVRAVTSARVIVVTDLADTALRAKLAVFEPSGRARVIVADTNVRAAVKAVRRGGCVCVGDIETAVMPSVTELVQREVTLIGPRDAAAVLEQIPLTDWSAAVAAA